MEADPAATRRDAGPLLAFLSLLRERGRAMTKPQWKIRAVLEGGHVRVTTFVRQPPGETWQNCGCIMIDAHQWPHLLRMLAPGCEIDDRVPIQDSGKKTTCAPTDAG